KAARKEAGEVTRAASDVEYALPTAQIQCGSGSFTLRRERHAVQAHHGHHDRPPDVLIDCGYRRAVHRALREAAPRRRTGPEQVGVAVAILHHAQHILADKPTRQRRHPHHIRFGLRPRPSCGHTHYHATGYRMVHSDGVSTLPGPPDPSAHHGEPAAAADR